MNARRAHPTRTVRSVVAVGTALWAIDGGAQTVRVPHVVSCPQCVVVAESLFTLGTTDADMLAPIAHPARDSRGRYFASGFGQRSVLVWDSAGKRIAVFGRAGAGPGEFDANIQTILVGRNDSLIVAEQTGRISVFAPTLQFVRSIRVLARPTSLTVMPDGHFVVGAQIRGRGQIGHPFHVIDGVTGTVVRSFGGGATVVEPGGPPMDSRVTQFTDAGDGRSIWHWRRDLYRLERWAINGVPGDTLDLSTAPWYRAPTPIEVPMRTREEQAAWLQARSSPSQAVRDSLAAADAARAGPPASGVTVAGVDRAGRVWAVGNVPTSSQNPGAVTYMLEVVDPVSRSKVLSTRVAHNFMRIRGADFLYSRRVDPDGVVTITVWRVTIRGL